MKRAEPLKDLSREHHEALVLARRASATAGDPHSPAAQAQRSHLLTRWPQLFAPHFAQEENTLLPALAQAGHGEAVAEALAQHTALRALVERLRLGDASALAAWGDAMTAHVRFEERSLFPLAQTAMDADALADLMKPPATVSAGRRAEASTLQPAAISSSS